MYRLQFCSSIILCTDTSSKYFCFGFYLKDFEYFQQFIILLYKSIIYIHEPLTAILLNINKELIYSNHEYILQVSTDRHVYTIFTSSD